MGITSALYTGVTGLQTLGNAIQVTGHNIANINTVGFKASRGDFSDLLSQTINIGGRNAQLGRGVQLEDISRNFSQGSFQNTDRVTDLAISGRGFFILNNGVETYYTRAGNFHTDDQGDLVSSNGFGVQGLLYDFDGLPTGQQGTINLSNLTTPATATEEISINANLDAEAEVISTFDPADPAGTSNYSVSVTIHDSLGAAHSMIIYFNKTAENGWEWHGIVDPSEVTGGVGNIVDGTLAFANDGSLQTVAYSDPAWAGFDFVGGAEPDQRINFNFGDAIDDGGTGYAGTRQYAGNFVTNFLTQDGFQSGNLQSIVVEPDGLITGIFSNGRTRPVAQLLLANFQNDSGLSSAGSNMFIETPQSGQPTLAAPASGAVGEIAGNTLELSNVDLSTEFVTMITNQRGFQANSRVVTVGDQMLQEIVNLAR